MSEKLPDAGEAFRLFLRSRTAVNTIAGTRIGVSIEGTAPCVRYSIAGGRIGFGEGSPLLLVEAWGRSNAPDDGAASDLARTVCAEVEQMRGFWGDAFVAGAGVETWPADAPDAVSKRPRQQFTVRLEIYPKENVA